MLCQDSDKVGEEILICFIAQNLLLIFKQKMWHYLCYTNAHDDSYKCKLLNENGHPHLHCLNDAIKFYYMCFHSDNDVQQFFSRSHHLFRSIAEKSIKNEII